MEYPKVLTLGSYQTDTVLDGPVLVQEKVDGSNFRLWINPKGEVEYGSHHRQIHIGENYGMFREAVEYFESIKDKIQFFFKPGTFLFMEYLAKPKHNCLKYEKIPTNFCVLFDMYTEGKWQPFSVLQNASSILGIDTIPLLYDGEVNIDGLKELLSTDSFLGGQKVEGVVVKNYARDIMVGGHLRPLFCKLVRPEFKEAMKFGPNAKHKETLDEYMKGFCNEARWNKAIQALKEIGTYTHSPKDIGPLIVAIHADIAKEEKENIQHFLYRYYINEIMRRSTAGFADWYKDRLLEETFHGKQEGQESERLEGREQIDGQQPSD